MEYSGATSFPSEANGLQDFRFTVSVHDDKLQIWLEDRVSKQQWRTTDLQLSDYVGADSAIPRATPSDYATHFVDCLLATQSIATAQGDDEAKAATPYTRYLSDVSKDGSRSLVVGVRLGVASSFFVDLEYGFTLLPVALEKVDILDAQVRDLKDDIKALQASQAAQAAEILALKQLALVNKPVPVARVTTELRSSHAAGPNDALRWSLPAYGPGVKPFVLSDHDKCVEVVFAGTYLLSLCISHTSSNTSTQLELVIDGKIVHKFTDGSPGSGATKQTFAPPTTNYARDSTFVVTAFIPAHGKVRLNYRGNASVNVGSSMSLVEL